MVPLKYLSNFSRTLEISLINCKINLVTTWSEDGAISSATRETEFKITDTKLYVPVVTLLTQENAKLLKQLSTKRQNQYLDYLNDTSFQGLNRPFRFILQRYWCSESTHNILSSKCRTKRLQCYDCNI